MSWGNAKHEKYDGHSLLGQLAPLVVLFLLIGGIGFVGYHIYLSVNKIQESASKNIGKNITFTKDGVRVGIKEVNTEKYVDATQRVLVGVWNQHGSGDRKRATKSK